MVNDGYYSMDVLDVRKHGVFVIVRNSDGNVLGRDRFGVVSFSSRSGLLSYPVFFFGYTSAAKCLPSGIDCSVVRFRDYIGNS